MGGDHGHGHPKYTVPDWRIYQVENCPELVQVQQALAAKGLKDPWLRNEVWRFNPKEFGTHGQRFRMFFFRGFKFGFGAFLLTIAAEKLFEKASPESHNNDHHH
ncbi:NADH dehydrogenase [ubiquinone] 1 beta subcomplex subunit 3 [Anabrus simplex]|uniref:NADH dehydrogenase [ubiquinone] 1 beta subcomplex subunit 3 n=1 Tax=Anabrus simplex TaxID=316456 RepID=UPI0035A2DCE9